MVISILNNQYNYGNNEKKSSLHKLILKIGEIERRGSYAVIRLTRLKILHPHIGRNLRTTSLPFTEVKALMKVIEKTNLKNQGRQRQIAKLLRDSTIHVVR